MVKADLERDYYGDLDIPMTADLSEVKKQFKKLALAYHPDRNPGRETEVISKFQRIQSAHEVLTDPVERAHYDRNRIIASKKTAYQGASGVRGNPWSNAGAQWAPPPRRPGAPGATRGPPPSAGAARYGKFEAPKPSASTANEGPDARRKVYEAWESMKRQGAPPGPSWKPPAPARDYTKPSGRDESNSYKHAPPPKKHPGFEDFQAKYSPHASPHRRAQSTGASNRRGFTPATPGGGDEPAAPKSSYFTQHKPPHAPEPPPRAPPSSTNNVHPDPARQNVQPDPLRQFRQEVDPTYETRQRTPYQMHGGEKLDPFESANINRSESTRERSDRPESSARVSRTESDPNLAQPQAHRSCSFADRPSKPSVPTYTDQAINSSSSDDAPEMPSSGRTYAQPRSSAPGVSNNGQRVPEAMAQSMHFRKPSVSEFQKWYRENPGGRPPLNGFTSDGPPTAPGQASAAQSAEKTNVYGTPQSHSNPPKSSSSNSGPNTIGSHSKPPKSSSSSFGPSPLRSHATVGRSEERNARELNPSFHRSRPDSNCCLSAGNSVTKSGTRCSPILEVPSPKRDNLAGGSGFPFDMYADDEDALTPSGLAADVLNPFEAGQRHLVDQLIKKRHASDPKLNIKGSSKGVSTASVPVQDRKLSHVHDDILQKSHPHVQESAATGTPSKKQKFQVSQGHDSTQNLPGHKGKDATQANSVNDTIRFSFKSFNIDDTLFSRPDGFTSSSTGNNMKFTPEDWDGKFEAGQEYFRPEQTAAGASTRGRAQSGTRSRGRSPVKIRPTDPKIMQPRVEDETPIESPGGTKFSADEWAKIFKPHTFMPPPPAVPAMPRHSTSGRKTRGVSIRPTMGGGAAILDDGENTSDAKPLFTGRKSQPTPIDLTSPSPDPMEVDTPQAAAREAQAPKTPTSNTVPVGLSPGKRAAARSPTDSALKVEFDDLKLRDLLSHLELPSAPTPPKQPVSLTPEYTRAPKAAYEAYQKEFVAYMCDWDLYINQFMFHILARKKQNDDAGAKRWEDDVGLETYRLALKEDKAVLAHWQATQENHQAVMKAYAVLKETMKDRSERERPRKKVS